MAYMKEYKTDFVSEFTRWSGIPPSEELIKATYKEQQEALAFMREFVHLKLVVNRELSRKFVKTVKFKKLSKK